MIQLLLAQANTPNPADGSGAWNTTLTIGVLLNLAVAVVALVRSGTTQKREVTMTGDYVPKKDFDAHVAKNDQDINGLHSKIGGMERGLRAELKDEVSTLRTDLTNAHTEMSTTMSRTFQDMERAIGRVEGKLSEE